MITVSPITKSEWNNISEDIHSAVFNWFRSKHDDKCDYALLINKDETPAAFVTVRERSRTHAQLLFGGVFPEQRGTALTVIGYGDVLKKLASVYDSCSTYIDSDNNEMIRISLKMGYHIIGTRQADGKLFVELEMDLNKWK